jgi:hypothetical protein
LVASPAAKLFAAEILLVVPPGIKEFSARI